MLFSTVYDIKEMFAVNPNLEFLLDIAHVKDHNVLCQMVEIKKPKILHIADCHNDALHEHIGIGEGDIDFKRIFAEPLADFDGKIIFEVPNNDQDRADAINQARNWFIQV